MSWICSLISLEMHETSSPPELSAREEEALKRTAKCLEGCRIADVCHILPLHPFLPALQTTLCLSPGSSMQKTSVCQCPRLLQTTIKSCLL